MTGFRAALVTMGAALVLGACAAPTPTTRPHAGAVALAATGARFEVLDVLPATGTVRAEDVVALAPGERHETTWDPDGPVRAVVTEPTDREGATVAVRTEGVGAELYARDDAGRVVITAVVEDESRTITRFDPPLVVAWPELAPGAPRATETPMAVLDARTRRPRESGTARRTMVYEDDQRVRTPLGERRARRVVISFTADLRMARAEETLTLWIADGEGVVASERIKSVSILGLPPRRTVDRRVRVD